MKSQVLTNDTVCLQVGREEHLALSRALFYSAVNVDRCELEFRGMSPEDGYALVYDVQVSEAVARSEGIAWLPGGELDDLINPDNLGRGKIVTYTCQGAEWHLTMDQLWFVEYCATHVARRTI